jgi:hypothetical protein
MIEAAAWEPRAAATFLALAGFGRKFGKKRGAGMA